MAIREGGHVAPSKPTRGIATAIVALLATQIALGAIEALTLIHRLGILHQIQDGGFVSQAQADGADNAVRGAAGIESLVFIASVVVWCIWQHRAQRRAIELTNGGLQFTPGWAVGWWFIPFADLVMPFKTVRELWKASHGGDVWRQLSTWPVLGWWWAFWIAGNLQVWFGSSGFSFGLGIGSFGSPSTLSDFISRDSWEIGSLTLRTVAAVLAILVVRAIERLQSTTVPQIPPMPGATHAMPDLPPLPPV